jgi:hypothetical protein
MAKSTNAANIISGSSFTDVAPTVNVNRTTISGTIRPRNLRLTCQAS